jgi:hypothetical protein
MRKTEHCKPTPPEQQCCANCQCCSPNGLYCYLWMVATHLSFGCNQMLLKTNIPKKMQLLLVNIMH